MGGLHPLEGPPTHAGLRLRQHPHCLEPTGRAGDQAARWARPRALAPTTLSALAPARRDQGTASGGIECPSPHCPGIVLWCFRYASEAPDRLDQMRRNLLI
jgi:hypothetical protein